MIAEKSAMQRTKHGNTIPNLEKAIVHRVLLYLPRVKLIPDGFSVFSESIGIRRPTTELVLTPSTGYRDLSTYRSLNLCRLSLKYYLGDC